MRHTPIIHTCKWDGGIITLDPTCGKAGVKTYRCIFNASHIKTESIPATGNHTIVKDAAIPATTTMLGLSEGAHCLVCGAVIVPQQIIPKLKTLSVQSITIPTEKTTFLTVNAKGLKKNRLILKKGKSLKLKVKSNKPVTFKSNKKKVVSVTRKGKLKALKKGKATITITAGNKKIKIRITVK